MKKIIQGAILAAIFALVMWDAEAQAPHCSHDNLPGYWHLQILLPEWNKEGVELWSLHLPIDVNGELFSSADSAPELAWIVASSGPVETEAQCEALQSQGIGCIAGQQLLAAGGAWFSVSDECVVTGGVITHPDGGDWYVVRGLMSWRQRDTMTVTITRRAVGDEPEVSGVGHLTQHPIAPFRAPRVPVWPGPGVASWLRSETIAGIAPDHYVVGWSTGEFTRVYFGPQSCNDFACTIFHADNQAIALSVCAVMADGFRDACTMRPY